MLSIIIPVYNVEKYIRECFESLCNQLDDDCEVICVDDGSTDRSGIICDVYSQKYNNFRVIHTENKGVASARNIALKYATKEYVAWVDPDDILSSNWKEAIVEAIKKYKADIICFKYNEFKGNIILSKNCFQYTEKEKINKISLIKDIIKDQEVKSVLWNKVFRRNLYDKVTFPEEYICMEDFAVLPSLVEHAEAVYYIDDVLYNYRIRDDSLVRQINIDKSYDSYLLAKERYDIYSKKIKDISKCGYLTQGLGFCIQFFKCSKSDRNRYKKQYIEIKKEVNSQLSYLLTTGISTRQKIQSICLYFNILGIAIKFRNICKG